MELPITGFASNIHASNEAPQGAPRAMPHASHDQYAPEEEEILDEVCGTAVGWGRRSPHASAPLQDQEDVPEQEDPIELLRRQATLPALASCSLDPCSTIPCCR